MIIEEDQYLKHTGKKGMKWGQRRAAKRQVRFQENEKKARSFLNTALKDPNVLIKLNGHTVVTGKEFTNHMVAGGLLNVKTTSIYAQQKNKRGPYILQ